MKHIPMETNTDLARSRQARNAAARLGATIVLNRARERAAVCADARAFATMPQTDWLTAMEHDLLAWLQQGGFAANEGKQNRRSGVAAVTKTAA
ncbi:hypothetical protein GM672_05200 [Massilia buxea]|uniref:Uncharacterized protein n=2 Tax=Pseudoduganella buxea TaxID=1949069 RepID=A0A6I3ST12_9BURK|nr:hypothetical protein [Pseudoduganella buxea]MTV52129.1 hypothetical protein [Pseudoduganella buxea]GGB91762.1 hypothetical protein GCM10011572_12250 [Pseudoduganella buxea]